MIEQSQAGLASAAAPASVEPRTMRRARGDPWRVFIGRILCVVVPIALWFAPLNLDPTIKHALAITSFIIIAWITEALDHALTGLIGCYLYWALGVVKFNVALGGFANDTAWFLLSAPCCSARWRNEYRPGAAAGIYGDLASRQNLSANFARADSVGFANILGSIRNRARGDSGRGGVGLHGSFRPGQRQQRRAGMFLILTYTAGIFDKMIIAGAASITARSLIERFGTGSSAVEQVVHRLSALRSDHDLRRLAIDVVALSAGEGRDVGRKDQSCLIAGLEKMVHGRRARKKTAILMLVAVRSG